MPRPSELLDTARLLASARDGSPTGADLCRCISTSYYAVFHAVLTAGADRFFGAGNRNEAGYRFLYRTYDHGRMKKSCEQVARLKLDQMEQKRFGRSAFHPDIRDFAQAFSRLQASRERADYDPRADPTIAEAQAAIADAERAIASFASAPDDERSDLLALMLGGRS